MSGTSLVPGRRPGPAATLPIGRAHPRHRTAPSPPTTPPVAPRTTPPTSPTTEQRGAPRSAPAIAAGAAQPATPATAPRAGQPTAQQAAPSVARRSGEAAVRAARSVRRSAQIRAAVRDARDDAARQPLDQARGALDYRQFNQALDRLRRSKGLSFQALSNNAGRHELPKSTAHMMCTRDTLPTRATQVEAFLRACGEPPEHVAAWLAAWRRLSERTRPPAGRTAARVEPVAARDPGAADATADGAARATAGEATGWTAGGAAARTADGATGHPPPATGVLCASTPAAHHDHWFREVDQRRLVFSVLLSLLLTCAGLWVVGALTGLGLPSGMRTVVVSAGAAALSTTGSVWLLLRPRTRP
ncbi:hypothetical protein [Saccharothrix australiensis]|uniref:Helix-turn-helix protein n=1 Tax=Saccharothrix australiensis TaxID=2072 RepID=A0A495W5S0_9PSEU|nr:hypothetical protein [Saccharothrix australiensis]RKT56145.1 hypothetical protein C8E97_4834 [Saccharothrix australiensis]